MGRIERIESRLAYEGTVATVRVERFRHPDGSVAEREVVGHPGAVAIVAHDERFVYLVRQPREAVGAEALLEVPAGKLDVEGETREECARRELAEEIGMRARRWRELKRFYTSPGLVEEVITVFLATELVRVDTEPDPEERIEVVPWPLAELDDAIGACEDAKSLVALQILRVMLAEPPAAGP